MWTQLSEKKVEHMLLEDFSFYYRKQILRHTTQMLYYLEPAISGTASQIMLKPRQICRSLNTKLKQYKIYNAAAKYTNNIQICHFLPIPLSSFHSLPSLC